MKEKRTKIPVQKVVLKVGLFEGLSSDHHSARAGGIGEILFEGSIRIQILSNLRPGLRNEAVSSESTSEGGRCLPERARGKQLTGVLQQERLPPYSKQN